MEISDCGMTTWDLSAAGGSGWIQFLVMTDKTYVGICAHVGSISWISVLLWTILGLSG